MGRLLGGDPDKDNKQEEPSKKGLRLGRKLKLLVVLAVLGGGTVGVSGGATIYGFTHGAVLISETFEVDAATATGSFWVELENRGLFPLTLDITFELRTVNGGLDLGSQTATFKLGPRAMDNQTLIFSLTPDMMAALVNGAPLKFTPSAKGTYAWLIKINEKDLEAEDLTVARINNPPTISGISVTPSPVEAGQLATLRVNVTDPDRDRITLDSSVDQGSLLSVSEGGLVLEWRAPFGLSQATFMATASDGLDLSDPATLVIPIVDSRDPELTVTAWPDYAGGELVFNLSANEPLQGLGYARTNFTASNQSGVTGLDQTPVMIGPNQWTTHFALNGSGSYSLVVMARDLAGNQGRVESITYLELVSFSEAQAARISGAELSLTIYGQAGSNVTEGRISVSQVDTSTVPVPASLASVGRFLDIQAASNIKDQLQQVVVVVNYTSEDVDALPPQLSEKDMKLFFYNEETREWVMETTLVDPTNRTLTALLDHLSLFAVLGSNIAPTAEAGEALTGQPGESVTFTASASDLDGQVVEYAWDFDGDGSYDWTGNSTSTSYTYPGPGIYTAKLRITDNAGATGFDTVTVTVEADTQSPGWALPGPGAALTGVVVLLASLLVSGGRRKPEPGRRFPRP